MPEIKGLTIKCPDTEKLEYTEAELNRWTGLNLFRGVNMLQEGSKGRFEYNITIEEISIGKRDQGSTWVRCSSDPKAQRGLINIRRAGNVSEIDVCKQIIAILTEETKPVVRTFVYYVLLISEQLEMRVYRLTVS